MTDPTITCPNCKSEIKLMESLAAPLLESTRQQFQQQMAEKDRKVAERQAAIKKPQEELQQAQAAIDEQVAEKLKTERAAIDRDAAATPDRRGFLCRGHSRRHLNAQGFENSVRSLDCDPVVFVPFVARDLRFVNLQALGELPSPPVPKAPEPASSDA